MPSGESAWVAQLVPSKAATTLRVPDVAFLNRAFREDTILHLAHASNFTANFLVLLLDEHFLSDRLPENITFCRCVLRGFQIDSGSAC